MLQLSAVAAFVGADGARIQELAGRSTGMVSHSVAVITHPVGTRSRAHHHTVADEVYCVQTGAGELTLDGVTHPIAAGDIITIRPGQTHTVACVGPADLVLWVTCAPAYDVGEVVWDE